MITNAKRLLIASSIVALIGACSGGTEGTGEKPNNSGLHGVVEAPGGSIALAEPNPWSRFFQSIFAQPVNASIDGVSHVGAGVRVDLVQVDANGQQIGNVIASSETKSDGSYNIAIENIPIENFQAASQYVVRTNSSSENMEARVSSLAVDVNPISDAASQLISQKASDLSELDNIEVEEIVNSVNNISKNVDPSGLSAKQLSAEMQQEAENQDASSNILNSSISHGKICGKVLSPSGLPLANIRIIARDYGDWVTRASTRTLDDGSYCINVPIANDPNPDSDLPFNGEYILGAINHNSDAADPERSASEWWTSSGIGNSQFDAEKILVTDASEIRKDFNLSAGGRINGKISDQSFGAPIEGITVVIRNYISLAPVASARTSDNGYYSVNLAPGSYFVEARNTTLQHFASEVYDAALGSNNMNNAAPVVVGVAQSRSINFSLESGHLLSGVVSKGIGGTAVTGHRIMVNLQSGGGSIRLRSNKAGQYNVCLKDGSYMVYAYGQQRGPVTLNSLSGDVIADFTDSTITTIKARILHNTIPVSQAKVRLYSSPGNYVNQEPSSSDGSVSIYTNLAGLHLIETRIDVPASYGSSIYNNKTQLLLGDTINIAPGNDLDLGDINLPDAGILTGKVSLDGSTPAANRKVSVWSGSSNTQRFITVRSRGDGSYYVSLPAGSYGRINFNGVAVNATDGCNNISVSAGQTTTLNYNLASASCSQP